MDCGFRFGVWGLGFRVWGVGISAHRCTVRSGLGLRVYGLDFGFRGSESRISVSRFRISDFGFWV